MRKSLPRRDNCRFCGRTWESLNIENKGNRQVCYFETCRAKSREEAAAEAEAATNFAFEDDWHAGRTQGVYLILATERGQSRKLEQTWTCWVCHELHHAEDIVKTLGITCKCGALFSFSLGIRPDGRVEIARVDRHQ